MNATLQPGPLSSPSVTDIKEDMNLSYYLPVSDSVDKLDPKPPGRIRRLWHSHSNYLMGLASRIVAIIIIIGVLIAIGIGLKYTDGLPKPEDFSHLSFDWKINPASYLTPYNTSFQYNVLLDGHSHSTYSDGKMNIRQLLDWHLGKN